MSDENPRFGIVHLADKSHKLPIPNASRLFSQEDEGETVDLWEPFWISCLADGSVKPGKRSAEAPASEGAAVEALAPEAAAVEAPAAAGKTPAKTATPSA